LGRSSLIIDRHPAGANTSRACVVHAATMEALEPLGVTTDLLAYGIKVPTFRIRDREKVLATIDFSELPTEYPFTLMCPQDRVEAYLEKHLNRLDGQVKRECELIDFADRGDHVDATVLINGVTQQIRPDWLVGCDGMHSFVRSKAEIPFSGGQYEQDFVLADVQMDWPLSDDEVTLFYSPAGLMVVAPLPGDRYRVVATVDRAPDKLTSDFIERVVSDRGPGSGSGRIRHVAWSSRFHIHHRVAQSPRKGRIVLCGDAAHVHSPAGGQGMNTGIQDAISLARELAVSAADGHQARLDEWAEKRHRVAADVVALTDRMTRVATIKSPSAQLLRNWAVAVLGHIPAVRNSLARTLAELDAD
jgi:2-polyprenyl-6-methoxyphenol hydroxylase-like FAD-dependent oxidoreductase